MLTVTPRRYDLGSTRLPFICFFVFRFICRTYPSWHCAEHYRAEWDQCQGTIHLLLRHSPLTTFSYLPRNNLKVRLRLPVLGHRPTDIRWDEAYRVECILVQVFYDNHFGSAFTCSWWTKSTTLITRLELSSLARKIQTYNVHLVVTGLQPVAVPPSLPSPDKK